MIKNDEVAGYVKKNLNIPINYKRARNSVRFQIVWQAQSSQNYKIQALFTQQRKSSKKIVQLKLLNKF